MPMLVLVSICLDSSKNQVAKRVSDPPELVATGCYEWPKVSVRNQSPTVVLWINIT